MSEVVLKSLYSVRKFYSFPVKVAYEGTPKQTWGLIIAHGVYTTSTPLRDHGARTKHTPGALSLYVYMVRRTLELRRGC